MMSVYRRALAAAKRGTKHDLSAAAVTFLVAFLEDDCHNGGPSWNADNERQMECRRDCSIGPG